MFSNFLETHSRTFHNPFDDLIDKHIYDMDTLDLELLKVDNPPATTTVIELPSSASGILPFPVVTQYYYILFLILSCSPHTEKYSYRAFPLIGTPIENFLVVKRARKGTI